MKGQPAIFSARNIFEVSFTEKVTGSGRDIFEVGLKFLTSEVMKKFNRTASELKIEEDRSASPSTKDYKNWMINLITI